MQGHPRVGGQPVLHVLVLVRGVVANDIPVNPGMLGGDPVQEVDELDVHVLLVQYVGSECSGEDVQRGCEPQRPLTWITKRYMVRGSGALFPQAGSWSA